MNAHKQAFELGFDMYREGYSKDANPYRHEDEPYARIEWFNGWAAAKKVLDPEED